VDGNGAPAAAHVVGAGSTLVLLHGLGGTWEIWKPVLDALAQEHRVVAVTLPGHHGGPAYAGEGDATFAGLADQLIGVLRAEGIDHAHVAGDSLGGWLAVELARRGFARSVTAFSPAGAWRSDADYQAIAKPFRIFYAIVGLILFPGPLVRRLGLAAQDADAADDGARRSRRAARLRRRAARDGEHLDPARAAPHHGARRPSRAARCGRGAGPHRLGRRRPR
jgi:pimeloyl-ACP methyl ester carboxylesterase